MFKTITCEDFRNQIEDFYLDKLDPVQRARHSQHRKFCYQCNESAKRFSAKRWETEGPYWLIAAAPTTPEEYFRRRHCLALETIQQYDAGELTEEEMKLVNQHLYDEECDICLDLVHREKLRIAYEEREKRWPNLVMLDFKKASIQKDGQHIDLGDE